MKRIANRGLALLMAVLMCVSLLTVAQPHAHAADIEYVKDGSYIYNWGTRGETATELSPNAEDFYTGEYTYANLSELNGGTGTSDAPDSALYSALKSLMTNAQTYVTSYAGTKTLFQYTDCQNSGKDRAVISSFYTGTAVGPEWDGGATWNREHTWPDSKGDASGDGEDDIMMLRPTAKSENSSRGNKAYGESDGFYDPNGASGGNYDLRGDVARIMLYVYTRWGNTGSMWGEDGVMESLDILLSWMAADPVDTWELGRNDSVESITGTRNVYVDYPELAFLLFGAEIPSAMTTPTNGVAPTVHTHSYDAAVTSATCTAEGYTTYSCTCGHSYTAEYTDLLPHSFVEGVCTVCGEADPNAGGTEAWTLVTDVADLQAGDQIIIAAKDYDNAMSTNQKSNNRGAAAVTKSGDTVSFNDDTQIITLENGTVSGTFAFQVGTGYLYAGSSSKNQLKTGSLNENASWMIEISSDGVATIKAQGTNTRNWMRYNLNNGDPLFSCYGSGQNDIVIYKLAAGGDSCDHSWDEATCTAPKTCTVCGATEGETLGHSWDNATCTAPKTCTVCGTTEGEALGHSMNDATCTAPKTCTVCGATEGEANGHSWDEATCTAPKTCTVCGATEGEANGHSWDEATCTTPKTCTVCGATEGEALGHSMSDATCTAPKTCSVCGATEGEANGHSYDNGTCTVCGAADPNAPVPDVCDHQWDDATCTAPKTCTVCGETEGEALGHSMSDATCTAPKTCSVCGATEGEALGHSMSDATCTAPKTCTVCGATEGEANGHSYENGTCTVCGAADPNAPGAGTSTTVSVSIKDYASANGWTNGTQYPSLEMDDVVTVTATGGQNTGKYYTSGYSWRTYQTENPSIKVSAAEGKIIERVKITYASEKSGVLTYNGTKIVSDTSVEVNAESITFGVGNNGTATNGQVRITAIEVVYSGGGSGEPVPCEHSWDEATCTAPKTCSVCGATEGEANGHSYENGTCTVCGAADPNAPVPDVCDHQWDDATCTAPKTCTVCGETEGEALGHSMSDATCTAPKTCSVCGATEGEANGHSYDNGVCTVCGAADPNAPGPDVPGPDVCDHQWAGATCTAPKTCSVCGATEGRALGHRYVSRVTTEPTCEEAGVRTHSCANGCGAGYTESIEATGHNEVNGTCTVCGKVFSIPVEDCNGEDCVVHEFTDLKADEWYHDGIHYGVEKGLFQGMPGGRFEPDTTTTRAQLVTILWRLEGCPEVGAAADFDDVSADQWYTKAISWATAEGIVGGYGNGLFGTDDEITREQLATLLYRYAAYKGIDVSVGTADDLKDFGDALQVQDYAVAAMQWACAQGLINGIPSAAEVQLAPAGSATRAQAATVLYRYCEEMVK